MPDQQGLLLALNDPSVPTRTEFLIMLLPRTNELASAVSIFANLEKEILPFAISPIEPNLNGAGFGPFGQLVRERTINPTSIQEQRSLRSAVGGGLALVISAALEARVD